MKHLRNGRGRIVAVVLLVVASGSRCVLDDGAGKSRCVTDDDCLGSRFCSEGYCRDDIPGHGGSAGMQDGGDGGVPGTSGDAGRSAGGSARGGNSGDSGSSGASSDSGGGGSGLGGTAGTGAGEGGMGASVGCPEMVLLPEGFCIDSTEVTRGAYRAWLRTNPQITPAVGCESDESFEPCGGVWNDGNEDHPATCVDWCDAEAYCRDAGKRLCGHIDGGPVNVVNYDNPLRSEWFAACSSSGLYDYPYGNSYASMLCSEGQYVPTASMPACHGPASPFDCVFDLSGNAREWENSCTDDTAAASCRLRGGGAGGQRGDIGFSCAADDFAQRTGGLYSGVGFRCCSDTCP